MTTLQPKQFYLDRIAKHMAADTLVRGTGWDGTKGCAIGCALENYDHKAFETAGLAPEWFAKVEDTLFEGMSEEKSRTWPHDCLTAIPDYLHGDTANPAWLTIKAKFLLVVLKLVLDIFDHDKFPDVKKAIDGSIAIWEAEDIGTAAWKKRATAASYAAYSAYSTADAADAADAAEAAAADAAADIVYSAAYAAAAAAAAAADDAARHDYFADELLKILREAVIDGGKG